MLLYKPFVVNWCNNNNNNNNLTVLSVQAAKKDLVHQVALIYDKGMRVC